MWLSCGLCEAFRGPFQLSADVEELQLDEYTLEHVRAFGMYNHLHLDPWYEDSVLFVDGRGRVLSFTVILVSDQSSRVRCVAE